MFTNSNEAKSAAENKAIPQPQMAYITLLQTIWNKLKKKKNTNTNLYIQAWIK